MPYLSFPFPHWLWFSSVRRGFRMLNKLVSLLDCSVPCLLVFAFLSLSLSLSQSVCPSVRPSVYLSVCPSVRPSICQSVCLSFCMPSSLVGSLACSLLLSFFALRLETGDVTTTIVVVGWLLNVPATCECISGTDLLRQFYVLLHLDRSCRSNFPSHKVTVY